MVTNEPQPLQEGIIEYPTEKRLVEELKKLQTHDPNVVPMAGGDYGKVIRDDWGNLIFIQPVDQPTWSSTLELERLVAESNMEDLNINTKHYQQTIDCIQRSVKILNSQDYSLSA